MARCVALVRFVDGGELFCVYCNTTGPVVGRVLFDTADLAQAARDAYEAALQGRGTTERQGRAPAGVEAAEERAVAYPYWQHGDLRFEFATRASRRHRRLTGPKGHDDMPREQGDGWFIGPPQANAE